MLLTSTQTPVVSDLAWLNLKNSFLSLNYNTLRTRFTNHPKLWRPSTAAEKKADVAPWKLLTSDIFFTSTYYSTKRINKCQRSSSMSLKSLREVVIVSAAPHPVGSFQGSLKAPACSQNWVPLPSAGCLRKISTMKLMNVSWVKF